MPEAKKVSQLDLSAGLLGTDRIVGNNSGSTKGTTPDAINRLGADPLGVFVWDNFQRADTAAGSLGTPPIGAAWSLLTTGAVDASATGKIESGLFTYPVNANPVYAVQSCVAPPGVMSAKVKWTSNGGATSHGVLSMGLSTMAQGSRINDMVHVIVSPTVMTIQSGFYAAAGQQKLVDHASLTFPTALSYDTEYEVVLEIVGSRAILRVGQYTIEADDPRIALNHGRHIFWEHFYATADAISRLQIVNVFAGNGGGSVPRPSRIHPAPRFGMTFARGASNKVRSNFASSTTEIGTGDFTLVWCGTVPGKYQRSSGTTLSEPNMLLVTTSTTGALNATGPALGFTAIGSVRCRVYSSGAAGYLEYQVSHRLLDRLGCPVQVAMVRRSGVILFYVNGEPAEYTTTSSGTPPTAANFVFTGENLFLGPAFSDGAANYSGTVYYAGLLNYAAVGLELAEIAATGQPPLVGGGTASNTALTSGAMSVNSVYRIAALATANFFYTGAAVGDRFLVLGSSGANSACVLQNDHLATLLNNTPNGTNTVTLLGAMCWLVATDDQNRLYDISGHGNHATIEAGTVAPVNPRYQSGSGSPSGAVVPRWIGDEYFDTSGADWWKSTGLTNTDWVQLNA